MVNGQSLIVNEKNAPLADYLLPLTIDRWPLTINHSPFSFSYAVAPFALNAPWINAASNCGATWCCDA